MGASLLGSVDRVHRVGLGLIHESAALDLSFEHLLLPDGREVPIKLKVAEVDNARERVDGYGRIRAARSTASAAHRSTGYISMLLLWNLHARLAWWMVRTMVTQLPEPEIQYRSGVEITMQLREPLLLDAAKFGGTPGLSRSERADLAPAMAGAAFQTYSPLSERPSDLINVLLLGSLDQISAAFVAAGWSEADPAGKRSSFRGIQAFRRCNGYQSAPMTPQLFGGKPASMSWQKSLNDVSKRHHVRIWKQPGTWQGQEIWLAAGTRDVDFAFLRPGQRFTHKIEQNIDLERDKIVHDLDFTSCVQSVDWLERPKVPAATFNSTGDPVATDGRLAVVQLGACSVPTLSAAASVADAGLGPTDWRFRLLRREILSFRSDMLRSNLYWRSFEGVRFGFAALRRRMRPLESATPLAFGSPAGSH